MVHESELMRELGFEDIITVFKEKVTKEKILHGKNNFIMLSVHKAGVCESFSSMKINQNHGGPI